GPAVHPPRQIDPSCSTTRNLRTVNSSTSSAPSRAFLISRRPTTRRPIASAPMATAPNAAAPSASANRPAAETALDCPGNSGAICDLHQLRQLPQFERAVVSITGESGTKFLGSLSVPNFWLGAQVLWCPGEDSNLH